MGVGGLSLWHQASQAPGDFRQHLERCRGCGQPQLLLPYPPSLAQRVPLLHKAPYITGAKAESPTQVKTTPAWGRKPKWTNTFRKVVTHCEGPHGHCQETDRQDRHRVRKQLSGYTHGRWQRLAVGAACRGQARQELKV